jgi:phage antirepressor YoqD-like protein
MESLAKIKPMVISKRMKMPRIGTRKLYYLLQEEIKQVGVKIGRDGLFSYLRWENMLIKPAKNYTVTTHSNH